MMFLDYINWLLFKKYHCQTWHKSIDNDIIPLIQKW